MRKNGFVGAIVLAIIIFGGVILGFSCTSRVPTGYVGVVYNNKRGGFCGGICEGGEVFGPTKKKNTRPPPGGRGAPLPQKSGNTAKRPDISSGRFAV